MTLRVALVLAAVLASAYAADLTWVGCNTDFANRNNWDSSGKKAFGESTPASFVYVASNSDCAWLPVDTYVAGRTATVPGSGVYSMYELVLASEGSILTLSADGTELVFYKQSDTSGDAKFIGGQPAQLKSTTCNFQCNKNWVDTATGLAVKLPPCDGDTATFPISHTYKVSIPGVVNVDKVVFDNTPITQKSDIPQYQAFPTGSNLQLLLNDNSNCRASGTFNKITNLCLCSSSCAAGSDAFASDAQLRNSVKAAATAEVQSDLTAIKQPFSGTFYIGLMLSAMGGTGVESQGKPDSLCLFGADNKAATIAAITTYIQKWVIGSSMPDLQVTYNQNTNTLMASSANFTAAPRTTPNFQTSFGNIVKEPIGPNMLVVHLFHAIYSQLPTCRVNAIKPTLDDYFNKCVSGGMPGLPTQLKLSRGVCTAMRTLLEAAINPISTFDISSGMLQEMSLFQISPQAATQAFAPSAALLNTLDANLITPALATTNMLTIYYALYPGASTAGSTTAGPINVSPDQIVTVADGISDVFNDRRAYIINQRAYPAPQLSRKNSTVTFVVGERLPQSDINDILDLAEGDLAAQLATELPGTQPLLAVDPATIAFALADTPADVADCAKRSRRGAGNTGSAQHPLQVTLSYTSLQSNNCTSTSTSVNCPLTPGTNAYATVESMVDNLVTIYTVAGDSTRICANFSADPVALQTCLDNYCQSSYCAMVRAGETSATIRSSIARSVSEVIKCPTGGSCVDADALAFFATWADSTIASLNGTVNCNSGGSAASALSSPAGGAGIGVGIGAGVLILIVVIVVVRRRRNNGSSGKADRNVVAFENPMYDDPTSGGAAPVYDMSNPAGGAQVPENEGLYDEPAFNANKAVAGGPARENPVYQSTENVAEEGGGYLDVDGQDEDQ